MDVRDVRFMDYNPFEFSGKRKYVEITLKEGDVFYMKRFNETDEGFSYEVIQRSRKGTGFDYWMGDESALPFQNKARLEISGIRKGGESDIKTRVKQKLKQTNQSDGKLPAYVIVIEFGRPVAEVRRK